MNALLAEISRQLDREKHLAGHFPLSRAMMCAEISCQAVFKSGPEACPCCLSRQFFNLESLVNRTGLEREIQEARGA